MNKNGYIINHGAKTITITKAFATRAANSSTPEYRELTKFHRDFPDYIIERRTAVIVKKKETYNGLTLDAMKNYIMEHDKTQNNNGKGMEAFEAIKAYYTPKGKDKPSYPKVKAWFLETYPQYGDRFTIASRRVRKRKQGVKQHLSRSCYIFLCGGNVFL